MAVDTLIIGSGVAACALAQRILDRTPSSAILILEAGSLVRTKDFGLWENYLVTGRLPYDHYKDLPYPEKDKLGENASVGGTEVPLFGARVIAHGGSTIHWGGWSFRLKPEDFYLHSNTGHGFDWPISYDDLEPYYCHAEHYLGVSGDSTDNSVPRSREYPFPPFPFTLQDKPIAKALDEVGIRYSHVPIARYGIAENTTGHVPCQTTGTCKYCPFGSRYTSADCLNEMAASGKYPNLEVRHGALVESIVMGVKHRAEGVIYIDKASGHSNRIDANRIVVAAGSIESAKILLRSTSPEWRNGVGNDADLVGRCLTTHPYFMFSASVKDNPMKLQPEMNFPTLCTRHFDSEAEQQSGKFILVNPADTVPIRLASQMQLGMTRDQLNSYVTGPHQIQLHGMIEVFGRTNNRVTNLLEKRNRLGMIETCVDYTRDTEFDARIDVIQHHVQSIFRQMGAELIGKPSISWRADHAASVCRMSSDDVRGVLDKNLRVHDVENLYVCSNAAFPSIGAINPTLTLTALAFRLGDHLST
ncbi:MAG: GMC family oxidoreductase [Pseudomonadota bacterium]